MTTPIHVFPRGMLHFGHRRLSRAASVRSLALVTCASFLLHSCCFTTHGTPRKIRTNLQAGEADSEAQAELRALRSQLAELTAELRELRLEFQDTSGSTQKVQPLTQAQSLPKEVKAPPAPPAPVVSHTVTSTVTAGGTAVNVKSAGYTYGDVAEFSLDGGRVMINGPANNRGVNILIIDPSTQRVVKGQCYDTWANPTDANRLLAADLNVAPQGHILLLALKDSGMENLDTAALQALQSFGSSLTGPLKEREGYALVGVKGGKALAEQQGQKVEIQGITLPCKVSPPQTPFLVQELPGGHDPTTLPGGYDVQSILEQGAAANMQTNGGAIPEMANVGSAPKPAGVSGGLGAFPTR